MAKQRWWPRALANQLLVMQNFKDKIGSYAGVLGLSAADVEAAEELCDAFIGAFNFAERCRTTMLAVTQWRDSIFTGIPQGAAAPEAPVFPVGSFPDFRLGVVDEFHALRARIVVSPGYNSSIGEDLGIIGPEKVRRPASEIVPNLKPEITGGNFVNIKGSMQGMDAVRVEYAPAGGNFRPVAFLTKTPAGFYITPESPTSTEIGSIRTVFIKDNADTGEYSPIYPVVVAGKR